MSHEVEYLPRAYDVLMSKPLEVRFEVISGIETLSRSPASLSRPAVFPYPPGYQIHTIQGRSAEGPWAATVFFRYSPDETTILILDIGWVLYQDDLDWDPDAPDDGLPPAR